MAAVENELARVAGSLRKRNKKRASAIVAGRRRSWNALDPPERGMLDGAMLPRPLDVVEVEHDGRRARRPRRGVERHEDPREATDDGVVRLPREVERVLRHRRRE